MKSYGRVVIAFVSLCLFFSQSALASQTDLLAYLRAHVASGQLDPSIPKYDRQKQFGGWAHQDPRSSCHNTREQVLERAEDPSVPLQFKANGCTISGGLWHDPYTGNDYQNATDLQIDHVVPLKNTYTSGAYAWESAIRCNFANFLANDFHLMAVNGHENMAKGEKGPDQYLPPNTADHCTYVSGWMRIKAIWQLTATAAEVDAIANVFQTQGCDDHFRFMDDGEIASQRTAALTPIQACVDFQKTGKMPEAPIELH